MIATTEAIVLKSMKYRDSSKLLTVYTEEFGRCSLIANGARKAKNKFGSALEPMSCSRLTFYKHTGKDLHTLSGAETAVPMRMMTESFDRITSGVAICEAVYSSQMHEEQNKPLYTLLKSSLLALNAAETNEQTLVVWFQAQYAAILGFALSPSICAASGDIVLPGDANEFVLSLSNGAPYSLPFTGLHTGFRIASPALEALQCIVALPLESVHTLALPPQVRSQLEDFFALYYEFHLERNITGRTQRFLQAAR
jgi:DNA repair protein RecO (recombination protein O)